MIKGFPVDGFQEVPHNAGDCVSVVHISVPVRSVW